MKKINILAIIILLITSSCRVEEYPDAIIGLWKMEMIDGSTNIGCQSQSTIRFTDSDFNTVDYEDDSAGICVIRDQTSGSYTINNEFITWQTNPVETSEILYLGPDTLKIAQQDGTDLVTITLLRQ